MASPRAARKHLAWALALSLALHLLLIVGTPRLRLGAVEEPEAPTPLTATLAPPAPAAPVPPAPEPPKPKPMQKPKPRPAKPAPAPPPPEPLPAPALPLPAAPEARDENGDLPVAPPADASNEIPGSGPRLDMPYARRRPAEPPPQIALPESADLEYVVIYGDQGFRAGRATHAWRLSGEHYSIRSVVEASGIVFLFVSGQYLNESEGLVTPEGLRPERYRVQRGKQEKTETATFDWDNLSVTLSFGGTTVRAEALPGIQDGVSFLHQLPFLMARGPEFPLLVANGRKIQQHDVQVVGEEVVHTGSGDVATVHLRRIAREDSATVEVWLAPDLYYLPVRIRYQGRRGDLLEQVLTSAKVR